MLLNMKSLLSTLVIGIAAGLAASNALAWSGPGHMIVATIAHQELSNDERQEFDRMMQNHPAYGRWQQLNPGVTQVSMPRFAAMMASMWPDAIRGTPDDRPSWHFVTFPMRRPDFAWANRIRTENDAIVAINRSLDVLGSTASSDRDKAKAIAWLIHVVGDIHQPLHNASLFEPGLPEDIGDKGGNYLFVKLPSPSNSKVNLHSYWDGQFGKCDPAAPPSDQVRDLFRTAITLRRSLSRQDVREELSQHGSPEAWCKESRYHWIKDAHQNGNFRYAHAFFDEDGKPLPPQNAPRLTVQYTQNARQVAEHRVVLAGYRLADLLRPMLR